MLHRKIRKSRQDRARNVGEGYFDFKRDRREERPVLDMTSSVLAIACIFLAFLLGLILGTIIYPQVKDVFVSREPIALAIEHKLTMMTVGKPAFDGDSTVITHTFKGKPNHIYTIEYSPDLMAGWENGDKHHTTDDGIFHATFNKKGDHSDNWNQHMFFRVSEIAEQENTLVAHND